MAKPELSSQGGDPQAVTSYIEEGLKAQNDRLRMVRTALGMTGTQLANRLGVTKARISKAEQANIVEGSLWYR